MQVFGIPNDYSAIGDIPFLVRGLPVSYGPRQPVLIPHFLGFQTSLASNVIKNVCTLHLHRGSDEGFRAKTSAVYISIPIVQ